ncbi:MAG: acyl-CoA dehydrogenase [Acidimicrobiia bacterium]|nr:acyl-CoA dehydrogenase [Acidimicrobiia bacterium]
MTYLRPRPARSRSSSSASEPSRYWSKERADSMIDFSVPTEVTTFIRQLRDFIHDDVVPLEGTLVDEDFRGGDGRLETEVLPPLREKARQAGVYGPQIPEEFGGLGLPLTTLAFVSEVCGPHPLASLAINMMAPDEATMHLLEMFGSDEQHERWLRPLAEGRIRSCFAMTEPDAGSDPSRISSLARRTGAGWRIDGHKVFTSGAVGAALCVVMAASDPDAPRRDRVSMFIVPTDAEGFEVVRELKPMGYRELGGLCEVRLSGVEVGSEALLGDLGAGLSMAQARLARGRLGHAMRWIGIAQAALDLAAERALQRETFGQQLSKRQAIQWWLADGATQLSASRLMVLNALWRIEQGVPHKAQISMIKTYVAETLDKIVDDALQVFGGWGYVTDFPLERWYRDARAARIYDGPSEVHRWAVARELLNEVETTGTARRISGDVLGQLI